MTVRFSEALLVLTDEREALVELLEARARSEDGRILDRAKETRSFVLSTGPRESLNNPMFAVSRGRGGLDVKLDDIADRPGAALVTGYGANGRYPRRSASFPAVPPAAGRLLPCHPVA